MRKRKKRLALLQRTGKQLKRIGDGVENTGNFVLALMVKPIDFVYKKWQSLTRELSRSANKRAINNRATRRQNQDSQPAGRLNNVLSNFVGSKPILFVAGLAFGISACFYFYWYFVLR